MTLVDHFRASLAECPLVAILRGIRPYEVADVGNALIEAGMHLIEIPMNTPKALQCIERLAQCASGRALVGAGTVLHVPDVHAIREAGGQMVVSPSVDADVVAATVEDGLISIPGFMTATEAFAAIKAGANALKLFPAETASPGMLRALGAVLPREMPILVVGGITTEGMEPWYAAGARGFGLGSSLYCSGRSTRDVYEIAREYVSRLATLKSASPKIGP